jgi:transcriptional regulator of arginine metabolism
MAQAPRGRATKQARQQHIREIVSRTPVSSQRELAAELRRRGFAATAATVSRDANEMGLVRIGRGEGHRFVLPEDLAASPAAGVDRLRRLLADIPVTVGRSGLILLLVGAPGTANAIAQAIDESGFPEPEGTLAGDNTTIVLFADEARLERWLARFRDVQALPTPLPARVSTSEAG